MRMILLTLENNSLSQPSYLKVDTQSGNEQMDSKLLQKNRGVSHLQIKIEKQL